jgi:hypothetical protein
MPAKSRPKIPKTAWGPGKYLIRARNGILNATPAELIIRPWPITLYFMARGVKFRDAHKMAGLLVAKILGTVTGVPKLSTTIVKATYKLAMGAGSVTPGVAIVINITDAVIPPLLDFMTTSYGDTIKATKLVFTSHERRVQFVDQILGEFDLEETKMIMNNVTIPVLKGQVQKARSELLMYREAAKSMGIELAPVEEKLLLGGGEK